MLALNTKTFYSPFTKHAMTVTILAVSVTTLISTLIEKSVHPSLYFDILVLLLPIVVFVDFLTGIMKSIANGQEVISGKMKRTSIKMGSYFTIMIGAFVVSFIVSIKDTAIGDQIGAIINNSCICFLIWTELTSICENLIEIDPQGSLAEVIKPIHSIFTFKWIKAFRILGELYNKKQR